MSGDATPWALLCPLPRTMPSGPRETLAWQGATVSHTRRHYRNCRRLFRFIGLFCCFLADKIVLKFARDYCQSQHAASVRASRSAGIACRRNLLKPYLSHHLMACCKIFNKVFGLTLSMRYSLEKTKVFSRKQNNGSMQNRL